MGVDELMLMAASTAAARAVIRRGMAMLSNETVALVRRFVMWNGAVTFSSTRSTA